MTSGSVLVAKAGRSGWSLVISTVGTGMDEGAPHTS